jgi:diguanylate cyclase (GGDEF)-like protein
MRFGPEGAGSGKGSWKEAAEEISAQDVEIGLHEWNAEVLAEEHARQEEDHGRDPLTGVHTRKFFDTKLAQSLERLGAGEQRTGAASIAELTLIFIDLDNFKEVNDTLGHAKGDEVLKRAAFVLQSSLREGDTLGRYGGDEFVALLPNAGNGGATSVAEKLRAALDRDAELKEHHVTGSIGVASTKEAISLDAFREQADAAMYEAKKGGRNRVVTYESLPTENE